MQKIKINGLGFFCFLLLLLSGCSTTSHYFNRQEALSHYKKEMRLESDMLLAESTHWNPSGNGRFWVFSFASKSYYNNYVDVTIPTYAEYQQNPKKWQEWRGGVLDGWSRLAGVLSKGTAFHIVDIAPRAERSGYWVMIQVDSGPHKGKNAIYVNAKSLVPDLYKQ